MSLYKRSDSPHWWVKISHSGRTIQRSTGTEDKAQAQEYHGKTEKLKVAGKPTVNRYLALVRAILVRSRDEWEWIDKVPKVKLFKKGPDRERSMTTDQAEGLLRELPAHQRDVVLFALATGLRQSNVLGLEWSHVNLKAAHAWVGASQSKNG
jgi:integrase